MLTGKHNRYSDNFAQTKGLRVAARQRCLTGLALSVTFGDTSPKGRGFGCSVRCLPQTSPFAIAYYKQ